MSVWELLDQAHRLGVELVPEGQTLRLRAPPGAITAEFREKLRARKAELLAALSALERGQPARIYSHHLGAHLWIVADPEAGRSLERELATEGDQRVVLTAAEAMRFGLMLEADAREIFQRLALIHRTMPGARLREQEATC